MGLWVSTEGLLVSTDGLLTSTDGLLAVSTDGRLAKSIDGFRMLSTEGLLVAGVGFEGVRGRWELDEDGGTPREEVGVRVDERALIGLAAR